MSLAILGSIVVALGGTHQSPCRGRRAPRSAWQSSSGAIKQAWKPYAKSSSKNCVGQEMLKHPELSMDIEKFVRAKVWGTEDVGEEEGVERFCRGKTNLSGIPPTYLIPMFCSM